MRLTQLVWHKAINMNCQIRIKFYLLFWSSKFSLALFSIKLYFQLWFTKLSQTQGYMHGVSSYDKTHYSDNYIPDLILDFYFQWYSLSWVWYKAIWMECQVMIKLTTITTSCKPMTVNFFKLKFIKLVWPKATFYGVISYVQTRYSNNDLKQYFANLCFSPGALS